MMKKEKLDAAADDILFQEINEELKNERMLNFWKKYGMAAMIIVVIALTCAVSYESILAWKNKKAQAWANTYAQAYNLQIQGDYDGSIVIFKDMAEKNDGLYRDFAKMQIINILLTQNKVDEAYKALEEYVNDEEANTALRNVAAVKLISYKLDSAPAQEINDLLEPLLAQQGSWTNAAKELKAMLAIREHNYSEAKDLYAEIVNAPNLPETMKLRAQNMLAVLNESDAGNK